jgi:hypothetical protein
LGTGTVVGAGAGAGAGAGGRWQRCRGAAEEEEKSGSRWLYIVASIFVRERRRGGEEASWADALAIWAPKRRSIRCARAHPCRRLTLSSAPGLAAPLVNPRRREVAHTGTPLSNALPAPVSRLHPRTAPPLVA